VLLRRLAVAGATTTMVQRELVAVAREVVGGARVELVDAIPADAAANAAAVVDVDAGAGRRIHLLAHDHGGAARLSDDAVAALRVVAIAGGLALEVAALRGAGAAAISSTASAASLPIEPEIPGAIAVSPVMRRLFADVGRLATSRATILITGESGAGKEVIARALHQLSPRAPRPYVAFNCAAVPHDLFEGQLFGYRKGAFTGATTDHAGVVRSADHGTVFLDEIGELPLDIQPKLLRFLDSGEVFPLGAQRPITVDVRVVAATNRDLTAEVARGRFREDLFYRLNVVPITVPPLRERKDDILPLARSFARALAPADRTPAFTPDALAALAAYSWPGNVRELRNAVERAMAYGGDRGELITRADLGI
jgi:transcriptional regulator with GAF, ATPase, and Fis domain